MRSTITFYTSATFEVELRLLWQEATSRTERGLIGQVSLVGQSLCGLPKPVSAPCLADSNCPDDEKCDLLACNEYGCNSGKWEDHPSECSGCYLNQIACGGGCAAGNYCSLGWYDLPIDNFDYSSYFVKVV